MRLQKVDHIAIICSNFEKSMAFYLEVLGMQLIVSEYREERRSHRARLALDGEYLVELFSFPDSPKRVDSPEAVVYVTSLFR
jgi:glyoxylase I family protein